MAKLAFAGAEVGDFATSGSPDSPAGAPSGTVTRDTATKRTGAASFKCDSTGTNTWSQVLLYNGITAASVSYYGRVYLWTSANPTTASYVVAMTQVVFARLRTDGGLELVVNGVTQGSPSASVTNSAWHRVELGVTTNSSSDIAAAELRVDGATVATWSGSVARSAAGFIFGWAVDSIAVPGANKVIYFDDVSLNDSTGSVNNSWCGDGKVILMCPTSDSQVGSWQAGGSTTNATTNLFAGVDNTPPVGLAAGSAGVTNQIRRGAQDTATSQEYRGNCGSYITAGVGAGDTVNAIVVNCAHGEEVSTNTKTGQHGTYTNPGPSTQTFTFGADAGAEGTYPTLWTWAVPLVIESAVTLGSSLVLVAHKTDSGTRFGSVCFLGAYVDYTPAVATTPSDAPNYRDRRSRRNNTVVRR